MLRFSVFAAALLLSLAGRAVQGQSTAAAGPTSAASSTVAAAERPSTNTLAPTKRPSQYRATRWTGDDGLPQSVVDAFAQTPDGFLWAATQQGLGRFDGTGFAAFTTRSHPALGSNNLNALAATADGALWVGTASGLARVTPDGAVAAFDTTHGLPQGVVYAVAATDAQLWVGTDAGLCASALMTTPTFTCVVDGLPDPYAGVLLPDGDGVWIGTAAGLAHFDGTAITSYAERGGVLGGPVLALARDDERLWVGGLDGLAHLALSDDRVRTHPDFVGDVVTALTVDPNGALWIGTDGRGLHRLYDGEIEALPAILGEAAPSISALLLDHEGGLWVGVYGQGVAHLRDTKLTPFGQPEGLAAKVAYSIAEGRNGRVWVGTDGGGVSRIEDGRVVATLRADGPGRLPSDFVNAVYETRDGALWVGTNGDGLARCTPSTGAWRCATFGRDEGLPDPYVLALFEARDGTLWVGTDGGLAQVRDGRLLPPVLTEDDGLGSASVLTFAEDDAGALWVGTYGGGFSRIEGGRVAATYTEADGLAHDVVLSLVAAPDGSLWIGTLGGGLSHFQGGAFRTYTTEQGLPSDGVSSLLLDAADGLWLGSERGLYRLPISALAVPDGAVHLDPVVLGTEDGARAAEGTGGVGPTALHARDGALWFPTIDGVVTFDPLALPVNATAPPVAVYRILIDGEAQSLGDARDGSLTLPPGRREFEFDYAALSFFAPDAVRFRYRLDGRDDAWSEPVARRQAFYTDLRPGTYTFRVQAANNDGVWNEAEARVTLTLEPFFYQTTWFLGLCVLALVGAMYGGFSLRTQQLRRRAEHLEQIVTERTRELAEEKSRVEEQKFVIEGQAGELRVLNERLEERVREQLAEIVRGSRLRKFFSKKVVDRILTADDDVAVANERKRVTVLFSDLKGFTRFSDVTDPAVVTRLLNDYLTEMVALIEGHGGTLDKFMGDGIMALFGAADQMPPDEQARQAVRCAAAMQHRFRALRATWADEGLPHTLDLRVGVNQAEVMVGNFGSDDLVEYTAIGQGVNLAARLEGACTPGQALVSFPVYALTKDTFPYSGEEAYQLKGIERAIPAYTLQTDVMEEVGG